MIDTELQQTEMAAFQAQALIEEARRRHRRRQRRLVFRLIAAVLFVGIAAGVITLSISRSPHATTTLPRFGGPAPPTNNTAYITTSEGILKVNLASKKVVGRITPHGSDFALNPIAIAPGGGTAYVVSDNIFTPINLASGLAMTPITLGSPTGDTADSKGFPSSIAIAPNGRTAYVAIPGNGTIVPVHLAPLAAASPIPLGGTPRSITIAPDGETAYVTNPATSAIDVINLATESVDLPIGGIVDPQQMAITPNGTRAYVSTGSAIVPIYLPSKRVLTPIKVGSIRAGFVPGPIAVSPDGQNIYVANTESGSGNAAVLIASTVSNRIIARLGGFSGPVGISVVGGGQTLYVLNTAPSPGAVIGGSSTKRDEVEDNALVPVDLNNGLVQTPIPIPEAPRSFGIGQE
jgi:DNA-binding beta-propeller fold protein YncE